MIIFRLSRGKHKADLSGKGAEIAGGRWNSKGIAILYASQSRALCTAEIAVHTPLGIVPADYWIVEIELPDSTLIMEVNPSALPHNWNGFPHQHSTQVIGDAFVRSGKFLVMKVPSAVVPGDFNYLVNPAHRSFTDVKIRQMEPFAFDKRLFVR